jgi:hypothetical protein
MDSEWVNRAGILAQGVAVFLITPQIAGEPRMRRLESRLREWAEAIRWPVALYGAKFDERSGFFDLPSLFSRPGDNQQWVWFLISHILLLVSLVGLVVTSGITGAVLWAVVAILALLTISPLITSIYWRLRNEVISSLLLPFAILWVTWVSLVQAVGTVLANMTLLATLLLVRVTAGEGRLATIVFASGLFLFILGTACLFWATL